MTHIQNLMARAHHEAYLRVLLEEPLASLDSVREVVLRKVIDSRKALALHYLTVEKRQLGHEFPIRIELKVGWEIIILPPKEKK